MSSVTSPQQTGRGGADTIPGPRGVQDVRLLVLGTDMDAQGLRDKALAAGLELAQRYSARVSHVAYGTGIDPQDAKYNKIREAGLVIVPIEACAEQLGLGEEGGEGPGVASDDASVTDSGEEAAGAAGEEGPLEFPPLREVTARRGAELDERVADERPAGDGILAADGELARDVEDAYAPLERPDLPRTPSPVAPEKEAGPEQEQETETEQEKGSGPEAQSESEPELGTEARPEAQSEPGRPLPPALPLAAAVIGADSWTGPSDGGVQRAPRAAAVTERSPRVADAAGAAGRAARAAEPADPTDVTGFIPVTRASDLEAADAPVTETAAPAVPAPGAADAFGTADAAAGAEGNAAAAPPRLSARYVLASFVWALIPFVSFGLLTPVVFGYAALRLRSRVLGLTTLAYTIAVVLSFALSAARPHAATPSDASGALLTLALAAAWIGGTVHAISIRVRVFGH